MPMPTHVNGKAVKTGSWTPHEDSLLAEWQSILGNRWSAVAKRIPGRTGQQCAQRWRHKVNPNIRKEKWTEEEDERLTELVDQFGNAWAEISRRMDGRTDQQCMGRWRRHLDPGIKRDAWKAREDSALMALYDQFGSQWSSISKAIPGRTAQQCRARCIQIEAVEEPSRGSASNPKSGGLPRKPARSRPKRHPDSSEDDDDSEEDEEEEELSMPPCHAQPRRQAVARSRLRSVAEQWEWERESMSSGYEDAEEEDISPPGSLSTPLKKAFSRAMNNSRHGRKQPPPPQPHSHRSSGTAHRSNGMAAAQDLWVHETLDNGRDCPRDSEDGEPDADREEDGTPESRPTSGYRSSQQQSSELASPPFLSQEAHAHSRPSEAQLLHGSAAFQQQQSRSHGRRMMSPNLRYIPDTTPQRLTRPFGGGSSRGRTHPGSPLSGAKRSTPGGGFRSAEEGWETSPTESVLHLFQSPQQGNGRGNPLHSPSFQSLATPEWAKRDWADLPPKSRPQSEAQAELPTAGKPLNRGPVARKLDIEAVLRGRAAADTKSPMQAILQDSAATPGRNSLCSPAKKFRAAAASDAHTPSRIQAGSLTREHQQQLQLETGSATTSGGACDALVHIQTMTDKENSACNALKQLSMAAFMAETSGEEMGSAQTSVPKVALGPRVSSPVGDASPASQLELCMGLKGNSGGGKRGSTQVRLRLHALLEDL